MIGQHCTPQRWHLNQKTASLLRNRNKIDSILTPNQSSPKKVGRTRQHRRVACQVHRQCWSLNQNATYSSRMSSNANCQFWQVLRSAIEFVGVSSKRQTQSYSVISAERATAISSKGRIPGNLKSKLFRGDSVATTIAVRSAGSAFPTNWTSWIEQASIIRIKTYFLEIAALFSDASSKIRPKNLRSRTLKHGANRYHWVQRRCTWAKCLHTIYTDFFGSR